MKRFLAFLLCAVMLLSLASCNGNNGTPDESSSSASSSTSSTDNTTEAITTTEPEVTTTEEITTTEPNVTTTEAVTTTEPNVTTTEEVTTTEPVVTTPPEVPAPVTGTWNGKTVTMEYDVITNIVYPADMKTIYFCNGFAYYYDYGNDPEHWVFHDYDVWNYIDKNGNRLLSNHYSWLTCFDQEGVAVGQIPNENRYVFINTNGEEIGQATYEEFRHREDAYYPPQPPQPEEVGLTVNENFDWSEIYPQGAPYYLGEQEVWKYSNVCEGLLLFMTGDHLIGVMDTEGSIIIEPCYRTAIAVYTDSLILNEMTFVSDFNNYIAIIKITIS